MEIKKKTFGILSNGKKVNLYTLKAGELSLSLTNLGATWTNLVVPSRKGEADILLGYSGLSGYLNNRPYLGVTVGRFANRIKGASFTIDGVAYKLEENEGKNTLHSGYRGFDKLLWKAEEYEEGDGVYVRFELESPDGEGGFPGNLKAVVTYGLLKTNELVANYKADADKRCPVNLTNHAYFNLAGEGQGSIVSHEVILYSSSYVEIDKENIPTGRIVPATGAFDFKTKKRVDSGKKFFKGFDHCFVVDGEIGTLRPCAEVYEHDSGRFMKVSTTQPGVQFYTGNYLNIEGKYGTHYGKHSGFCLETQHFPDTPNQIAFPQCNADPDNDYHEKAVFSFDW